MRASRPLSIAAALGAATLATAASNVHAIPVLIDFDALGHGVDVVFVPQYLEDGFAFTSSIDPDRANEAFASWGPDSENWTGSAALFNTFDGFVTTFAREDGAAFDLTSIDLAPAFAAGGSGASITFIGTKIDGAVVTQTASFGADLAPATFTFGADFTALARVAWEQGEIPHQFDNFVTAVDGPTPPIPEPAAGLLMLAGVAATRLRRRSATVR
jgi:MYXO-CTERM domain-containing protein